MIKTNKNILITGGSGALGSNIQKLIKCHAPNSKELDVRDLKSCLGAVKKYNPDIIIHCAAWTDVAGAEKQKKECWQVNVNGTKNMVKSAVGKRFIYISTEYVFDGEKGMYKEDDTPNPVNFYALTKVVAEAIVGQYPNTLIIRTAFKKDGPWPYEKTFIDQWMSADFASERAPEIVQASLMEDLKGVLHISGDRKTIYDLAKKVSPNVGKMSINDLTVKLPRDTSLDSSKWKKIKSKSNRAKK